MKKKDKYKYLSKNVILFALNSFIPKLLAFFLIPLYTSCLTTEEYGVSELITTTVTLLIPIFSLDICDAAMKFALDRTKDKNAIFSSSFRINGIGIFLVSTITLILSAFGIIKINIIYILFFIIAYIFNSLHNLFLLFCKGIEKVNSIVISSIINSIVTISLNILLLLFFDLGITGYLIANSVGMIISVFFMFVHAKLYKYFTRRQSKELTRNMIKYSFPLIFNVIGWWINNASDRYIVAWMLGTGVSGLYSISYKIPSILTTFQTVFSQAWSISAIKEFDKEDSDSFIGNTYQIIFYSMVFICSMILIINIPLAKMLYSKDFFVAWEYVPPLLVSVVVNCMSSFLGGIYSATENTKIISVSAVIGAIFNIVFNFILIYLFGPYGAAISTLIGYFIVLLIRHIMLKKIISIKLDISKICMTYLLLLTQMVLGKFYFKFILLQILIFIIIIIINIDKIIYMIKMLSTILKNKLKKVRKA